METRLVELERQLARARRREQATRWLAVAALVAAVALGALRPAVIEARQDGEQSAQQVAAPFRVVDGDEKPLLSVERSEQGTFLRFFDVEGTEVALLWADADGGNLSISDPGGRPVALFFADPQGGNVGFYNREGAISATLRTLETGGRLDLNDQEGTVVQRLPAPGQD